MRIARAFVWLYPAFVLAIGLGFLVWSYFQAADADAYRNASQCGSTVTPSCYETFAGIVTSVHVSQTRSGERDDVDIKTETAGNLTATLEPSASAAPHVRTGANVTVKRYRGQVTLVTVDGYGVASTANPDAARTRAAGRGVPGYINMIPERARQARIRRDHRLVIEMVRAGCKAKEICGWVRLSTIL